MCSQVVVLIELGNEFSCKISLNAAFSSMRLGWEVCLYRRFRMQYLLPPPVVYLFIGSLRPLREGSLFLEVWFFSKS